MPKVYRASGTIRVSRFVNVSGNSTVAEATTGDAFPVGISQAGGRTPPIPDVTTTPVESAQSGENVQVFTVGEECLIRAGASFAAGQLLMPDADGDGIAHTTNKYYGAIALEAAGGAGELVLVQVLQGWYKS